jgi:hypothetical protein
MLQVLEELAKCHDWLARGRTTATNDGRYQPSLAHGIGQQRIGKKGATAGLRGNKFGYDAIPIGDKHCLPPRGEANVFAKLVL